MLPAVSFTLWARNKNARQSQAFEWGKRGRLGRLNLKARVFDGLHYLLGRDLAGGDGENLVGIGRVHLPVAGTGLLVERGRNGLEAATAIDVGFKLEGFHESQD